MSISVFLKMGDAWNYSKLNPFRFFDKTDFEKYSWAYLLSEIPSPKTDPMETSLKCSYSLSGYMPFFKTTLRWTHSQVAPGPSEVADSEDLTGSPFRTGPCVLN